MGILGKLVKSMAEKAQPLCSAVIPAAGSSSRMGGTNKLLFELDGVPVLIRTLRVFEQSESIHEIIVVTREDEISSVKALCEQFGITKISSIVPGGSTRTESVLNGVKATNAKSDLIAIHDAARPFLNEHVLNECISAAKTYHAAAPAVPVKDTVKEAEGKIVVKTLCRDRLSAIQTPQIFTRELILAALSDAQNSGAEITDDCSAVERLGMSVFLTKGDYYNLKITTPEDLVFAKAILELEGK